MARIFISYRREDSAPYAGRLHDRLVQEFGRANVFMDIDTIDPGVDFVQAIEAAVSRVDFMLCVIGPSWLLTDANGRLRLEDPHDFVALEVASALDREIRVVPVLVGGAELPTVEQLPEALHGLTRRNAIRLDNADFQRDADRLVDSMRRALGTEDERPSWKGPLALVASLLVIAALAGAFWLRGGLGTGEATPAQKKVAVREVEPLEGEARREVEPAPLKAPALELVRWSVTPSSPSAGQRIAADVVVRNTGGAPTPRFNVQWWPSRRQKETVEKSMMLRPGQEEVVRLIYGGFERAGSYESVVIVDREGAVPDQNRKDNSQQRTIRVAEGQAKARAVHLVLVDPGQNRVTAVKLVRKYTGLGLAEAKKLVDNAPQIILKDVSRDVGREALAEFEKNGVEVALRSG